MYSDFEELNLFAYWALVNGLLDAVLWCLGPYVDDSREYDAQVDERETILRQRQERFGDRLRLDGSPESVVEVLPKRAGLNLIESAVLRDLIWRKMTHQEFADEYGIPLGSVGRIRAETLRKIRVFFHQNGAL